MNDLERNMFNELHEERKLDAKTFSKPDYQGLWSSVVDKYKEKAHFVYELLQNADDAKAKEATFIIEKERLIFRHNGTVHFTVTSVNDTKKKGHINAITGVGNSNKKTDGNTIGKFGVGFKAVFQYTDEPQIYDDNFWFKIENYIVPTALQEDFEGREPGETLFVFPFNSPDFAYKEIVERLKHLNNPILFLRHLEKVRIVIPGNEDIVYGKVIEETYIHDEIRHELMSVMNNGERLKIHMFSQTTNDKEVKHFISVGYLLNSEGELDDNTEGKVYCFFPTTESFDLHCIVHAPFLLVDNRQQLKDERWNKILQKQLAELAAKALIYLRDYGVKSGHLLIKENLFNFIPKKHYSYWHYDNPFYNNVFREEYLGIIKEHKLLLARQDHYINCNEALICHPISMMNILTDEQIEALVSNINGFSGKYFLREETQKICNQDFVKELLEELEVHVFDGKLLAKSLTPSFMNNYGLNWVRRLYSHLKNEQVRLWKITDNFLSKNIELPPFCLSPIILTSKGDWMAPYLNNGAPNVFLPLATDVEGYNFISSDYEKDEDLKSFVLDWGLKKPDTWNYIQSVMLKKHVKNSYAAEESNNDLELIYDYLSKLEDEVDKKSKLEILSKDFLLADENGICHTSSELYDDTPELKRYFTNNRSYIGLNYYIKFIDKYSETKFRKFINEMGVLRYPKVDKKKRAGLSKEEEYEYKINATRYYEFDDYYIDGFVSWTPQSINDSKFIWNWLSKSGILERYKMINVPYYYRTKRSEAIPSTLFKNLKDKNWIILNDGKQLRPTEVSKEDLISSEYEIDYDLLKVFGIEERSIASSNLTEEEKEQLEMGKMVQGAGMSKEGLQQLLNERSNQSRQKDFPDKFVKNINQERSSHNTMRATDLKEMSSSRNDYSEKKQQEKKSSADKINDIKQKSEEETNKKVEEESKRAEIEDMTKYSKIWFDTLLELEYSSSSEDTGNKKGAVRIVFERFGREPGSDKIYILSNPSRNIPIWIEELGELTVRFSFFNQEDICFTFDVANVKDFTLRVKAKNSDISLIDQINWRNCTKAVVEMTGPVEIMSRLKNAFSALPYEEDFDFKENLTGNISFVFGPPGTGKTTRLAEIICGKVANEACKILVLAPTNKACDVLTKKIIDISDDGYPWLGRFVATGEESIEKSGALIDRTSDLWQQDTCCIVSTIARFPYDGFSRREESGLLKEIYWDFIIIDEASMIPLVQIVYTLYKQSAAKFIIAGDPLQIEPIVSEQGWTGENIYTMVELNNFENPQTQPIQFEIEKLGTQYRSIPSIGTLYSQYCYGGRLSHSRTEGQQRNLPMGKISAKAINFVLFPVEKFDSIFGPKKLQGSNVHIYSALLSVETCSYIARQQTEATRIGVICPYAPQAQLINKLLEQRTDIPNHVEIVVGTIHGFQGDQCDIVLAVFNPPTGIKVAPERIMLNKKHIINVAISRASDYLFVLLPHPDSYGYDNLIEINRICGIANQLNPAVQVINSDKLESCMFGAAHYIEDNTFVTTHQLANVYTAGASLYEVRIDDNAVDIQLGNNHI